MGLAPPLTEDVLHEHLHHTAAHLSQEFREANKRALLNVVSGGCRQEAGGQGRAGSDSSRAAGAAAVAAAAAAAGSGPWSAAHRLARASPPPRNPLLSLARADLTSASVFFVLLSQPGPQRQILFRTIGRIFTGLSDTAKAFLIILTTGARALPARCQRSCRWWRAGCGPRAAGCWPGRARPGSVWPAALLSTAPAGPRPHPTPPPNRGADILLGYHSEEGWTATLRLFSGHYGLEAEVRGGGDVRVLLGVVHSRRVRGARAAAPAELPPQLPPPAFRPLTWHAPTSLAEPSTGRADQDLCGNGPRLLRLPVQGGCSAEKVPGVGCGAASCLLAGRALWRRASGGGDVPAATTRRRASRLPGLCTPARLPARSPPH